MGLLPRKVKGVGEINIYDDIEKSERIVKFISKNGE